MASTKCTVCRKAGPEKDDPFEALDAAVVDAGFVKVTLPDEKDPRRTVYLFFCKHCAKYVRTYFLTEAKPSAESVLIPEAEDEEFENSTEY